MNNLKDDKKYDNKGNRNNIQKNNCFILFTEDNKYNNNICIIESTKVKWKQKINRLIYEYLVRKKYEYRKLPSFNLRGDKELVDKDFNENEVELEEYSYKV